VAKPLCVNCGVVESVTPIQREGSGSGLGAVAGAVLGGVLGNQVGGGDGKTAATVLGVFGGSIAGNAVEKQMKKDTVYEVRVRMENGSTRTLEQITPASVGTRVIVDGNTLQPMGR
jgi:outer membrane lipoprotein SlyB